MTTETKGTREIQTGDTVTISGNTYASREILRALGLRYNGDRAWTGTITAPEGSWQLGQIRREIASGELRLGGSAVPTAKPTHLNWRRADGSLSYDC